MKQVILKSIEGQGFLSLKKPFYFDITQFYGQAVSIIGDNTINPKADSNGAGKSTLLEAFSYLLFGEVSRNLRYNDEIINWNEDSCFIKGNLEVDSKPYEIYRRKQRDKAAELTIKVGRLKKEILPQADTKSKQAWLINLLGIDFISWVCAIMFHQDYDPFPNLKPAERANILSKIADLDIYIKASEKSKLKSQNLQNMIDSLTSQITMRLENLQGLQTQDFNVLIDDFEMLRQEKMISLRKEIKQIKDQTEKEKKKAQDEKFVVVLKIKEAEEKIKDLESKKTIPFQEGELDRSINELKQEVKDLPRIITLLQEQIKTEAEIDNEINNLNRNISGLAKEIDRFKILGEGECPTCRQIVSAKHLEFHITEMESELKNLRTQKQNQEKIKAFHDETKYKTQLSYNLIKRSEQELQRLLSERQQKEFNHLNHLNKLMQNFKDMVYNFKLEKHSLDVKINSNNEDLLINEKEKSIRAHKEEKNPYIGLKEENTHKVKELQKEISKSEQELKSKKDEKEYYSFWVTGYKRLRMLMFDTLIIRLEELSQEFLNNYCSELSVSISGDKELKSGNRKDEIYIEVSGEEGTSSFEAYSGGEKQKVKLSISLALSQLIKERCGKDFNFMAFDEMNTALDDIGKETNFQVIKSLTEEGRSIFVIDHDSYFKDRFESSVLMKKEKDGTRIIT